MPCPPPNTRRTGTPPPLTPTPRSLRKWRAVLGTVAITYGDAGPPPAAASDTGATPAPTRLGRVRRFGKAPARPIARLGRAVTRRLRTLLDHLIGA